MLESKNFIKQNRSRIQFYIGIDPGRKIKLIYNFMASPNSEVTWVQEFHVELFDTFDQPLFGIYFNHCGMVWF